MPVLLSTYGFVLLFLLSTQYHRHDNLSQDIHIKSITHMIQRGYQAGDESKHIEQIQKRTIKADEAKDILGYFPAKLSNRTFAAKSRKPEKHKTEQTNTTSNSGEIFQKRNLMERGKAKTTF